MFPLIAGCLILAPASVPDLFPREIPLPADARVVLAQDNSRARAGSQSILLQFTTSLATPAVLDLYRGFFREKGKVLVDLGASGVPLCSGQLGGYQCIVSVIGNSRTVNVVVEPEGRTFTAFHEREAAARGTSAPIDARPPDTSRWRLSGALFPGDHYPGALVMRHRDGSLRGLGLALVHPRPAVDANGKRYCDNDTPPKGPVDLRDGARFAVAAPGGPLGAFFVIDAGGTLSSFGADSGGRLGQGIGDATFRWFDPVPILRNVRHVVAESANTAAITDRNELYVWGSNLSGQVPGHPDTFARSPVKVLENVVSVALARDAAYAVKTDGSLWGWGEAYEDGFLDGGVLRRRKVPYFIMDGVRAVFTADIGPVAVIKADGSLWTWGANSMGQCGHGTKGQAARPQRIAPDVERLAMDGHHAALLRKDGSVWTWGWNLSSQTGFPKAEGAVTRPRKLADGAVDVAVTSGETYVLKADGSLWGCGRNSGGVALQGRGGLRQAGLVDTGLKVD